jgi:DNA adenine methylase
MSRFNDPPPYPFLKWVGGKRQLLPELLEAVEAAGAFRRYHEPFLGGGALFFALARTGRLRGTSFLSDVNHNLIDAYLGVRDDARGLIRQLERHKSRHSEDYFYDVRATAPETLTKRAARLIYLNKTCFNGLYRENSKGQFNTPFGRYVNPRIVDERNLLAVSDTLRRVKLGARGFASILTRARRGDLVYFDPPYIPINKTADFTAYSKGGFGIEGQRQLADVFARLAGRGVNVMLSNSMTELTIDLYDEFFISEVFASRLVNSKADRRGKVSEALITSFPMRIDGRPQRRKSANGKSLLPPCESATSERGGIEPTRARQWLRKNGYDDIADMIDKAMDEWKTEGNRTRRNWWEVLAGDSNGKPRVVAGLEFPVLRAAQVRQGLPVSDDAVCRDRNEKPPAGRAPRAPSLPAASR